MISKILIGLLTPLLLTVVSPADAQQPTKIPRIGYISGTGSQSDPGPYVEALRQGLRDLGHIDGKNVVIEYRGAEGKPDRYSSLVNELVELKVDVLVVPPSNSRSEAGNQNDPHRDGDQYRSSRG